MQILARCFYYGRGPSSFVISTLGQQGILCLGRHRPRASSSTDPNRRHFRSMLRQLSQLPRCLRCRVQQSSQSRMRVKTKKTAWKERATYFDEYRAGELDNNNVFWPSSQL